MSDIRDESDIDAIIDDEDVDTGEMDEKRPKCTYCKGTCVRACHPCEGSGIIREGEDITVCTNCRGTCVEPCPHCNETGYADGEPDL